jgi:predicted transcriptional regulator
MRLKSYYDQAIDRIKNPNEVYGIASTFEKSIVRLCSEILSNGYRFRGKI